MSLRALARKGLILWRHQAGKGKGNIGCAGRAIKLPLSPPPLPAPAPRRIWVARTEPITRDSIGHWIPAIKETT
jgi:hypothetical protein